MNTRFNPRASGGIGFHFEHYVQATFLLSLITGTPCDFDQLLTVEQLELQARHAYYTDDAVVTFNNGTMLHIQCKLGFKINNSATFVTTIIAMWKDHLNAQLSKKKETRFLVSTDKLSTADARTGCDILKIARTSSDDVGFFKKIRINKSMYSKLLFFKNAVAQHTPAVDDFSLWSFLRLVYIEEKDFMTETSKAERMLEFQIAHLTSATDGRALLCEMLVYISKENGFASTINSSTIDRRLYSLFHKAPKDLMPNLIETGLANRDRYMLLLSLVGEWAPKNNPDPIELKFEFRRLLKETEDTRLYPYVVNLAGFFWGKAGHQYRVDNKINLGALKFISEQKSFYDGNDHSAAAKWILARISASDAAFEKGLYEKYRGSLYASELVSAINEPVRFPLPVLLPGIKSELVPDDLGGEFSQLNDPETQKLPIPHRYIAAYLMNLAIYEIETDRDAALTKLEKAQFHCENSIRLNNGSDREFLLINIEQAQCVVDTYRYYIKEQNIRRTQVINRLESLLKRIDMATRTYQLPAAKAAEWIAATYAAMAVLSRGTKSRSDFLDLFYRNAEQAIRVHKSGADSFLIDAVYRIAHDKHERAGYVDWVRNLQRSG